MNNYIPVISKAINEAFDTFVENEGLNTTDRDRAYEALSKSYEPQYIEEHERINKDGSVTMVKGYWKQPKPITAMDIALIEAQDDASVSGVNVEAVLARFVEALTSGQIQLGNLKI